MPTKQKDFTIKKDVFFIIDKSTSMLPWSIHPSEITLYQSIVDRYIDWNNNHQINVWECEFSFNFEKFEEDFENFQDIRSSLNDKIIFVITDFVSESWKDGRAKGLLESIGDRNHIVLVNVFSQTYDSRNAISNYIGFQTKLLDGKYNSQIEVDQYLNFLHESDVKERKLDLSYIFPSIRLKNDDNSINFNSFLVWCESYTGKKTLNHRNIGYYLDDYYYNYYKNSEERLSLHGKQDKNKPHHMQLVDNFFSVAFPPVRKLAYLLMLESPEFDIGQIKLDIHINKKYNFTLMTSDIASIFLSGLVSKEYIDPSNKIKRFFFDTNVIQYLTKDCNGAKNLAKEALQSDVYDVIERHILEKLGIDKIETTPIEVIDELIKKEVNRIESHLLYYKDQITTLNTLKKKIKKIYKEDLINNGNK